MKLSVKWLAGLAVLVLAVVAVVGSTSTTKAADGSIFVVNEWSTITNESPAPAGRVSRSTVFATIDDGAGSRLIEVDSDVIRVVVKDADYDVTVANVVTATANITVSTGGDGNDTITATAGNSAVITLAGLGGTPISGDLASVQANTVISVDGGTTNLVGTELAITNFYAGSGSNPPWIAVAVNITGPYLLNHISYQTSSVDTITVTVKSELETTGVTLTAQETGLSTGIFEGFVRLVPSTATSANGTPGSAKANAATIRTTVGPITVSFDDDPGTPVVTRSTTASVDTSAPVGAISGPASGSATQNRRPTFSGTITETGAGLDVSAIQVAYDSANDATNTGAVVDTTATGTGPLAGSAVTLGISTSGAVDGDTAFSFSQAPTADLPSAAVSNPDHIVDWVVKAVDLAGNIGLSDANASTTGIQLPTVKIDTVIPAFDTGHKTGVAPDSTDAVDGEKAARNTVRVVFNDQLQNVQASDFTVTLDSTAVVVPTGVTVVNNPTLPAGFANKSLVYLTLANDLVSNETPNVALQDTISDLAGNFTSTGSVSNITDGIAPSLTVALSGGSGTGSGSEGPASLTDSEMTITITSDEPLSGAPVVTVSAKNSSNVVVSEGTPGALAQGANKWTATFATVSQPDGKRSVKVDGTDLASNTASVGSATDVTKSPNFTVDTSLAPPTLSVGGGSNTTDQTRPSVVIDYKAGGEASTVTLTKVELDGVDITADVVAASDGKRFFYIPPSDLSLGSHSLTIAAGDAADAAGNEGGAEALTLTIEERATFNIDVFAGWNAVSFPSDPIDPDINSVFGNAGHDAVLGFDPSVPGGWRVAVRDTVSGMLEPASEGGLTTVRSTQAYWLHSNNFEQVQALLVGEVLPAAGSPPGIVSIPTVLGFNAVPIVDTSRKQTTGDAGSTLQRTPAGGGSVNVTVADYLGAVSEGRVYKWNSETLTFELASGTTGVNTGEVLFVEVTGTPTPIFP